MGRTRRKIWPDANDYLLGGPESVSLSHLREAVAASPEREHRLLRTLQAAALVIGLDPVHGGREVFWGQDHGEGATFRHYGVVVHIGINLQNAAEVSFLRQLLADLKGPAKEGQ
ncbi:MAG: hypothetical protein ACM359_00395 [Bacillota bacterium]